VNNCPECGGTGWKPTETILEPNGAAHLLLRRAGYWDKDGKPSDTLLLDYFFQVLDEEDRKEVEAYLLTDEDARKRLEEIGK